MSSFYTKIFALAENATPQVAMDLGILAGFLSGQSAPAFDETRQAAQASLLRLAELLTCESSEEDGVDLDDVMDKIEETKDEIEEAKGH